MMGELLAVDLHRSRWRWPVAPRAGRCGLRVLVRVLKWTRGSGEDMYLVGPRLPVRRVLETSGLIGVFSVYPSVEQAVTGARLALPLSAAVS